MSSNLKYFTKKWASNATTTSPIVTHFNHLRNIPRAWLIRRSKHDPKIKSVKPADRIKWWNIIPGDQVRLRGDRSNTVREVLSINRLSNRVFLKNTAEESGDSEAPAKSKNYHYSRCQLYIDDFPVRNPADPAGPEVYQPVFASRLSTVEPKWHYVHKRWAWERFATVTYPRFPLPDGKPIHIPWPKTTKRPKPEPGLYDTTQAVVERITYQLPKFDPSSKVAPPSTPEEKEYLDFIYNSHQGHTYDPSAAFEIYLQPDLANPHSRAKKLQRWKSYQAGVDALRKKITSSELAHLDGRTEKQARADAAFKWREQIKEEQAKKKKARWMHTEQMVKWAKKTEKKAKKEDRQRRRLTELMLAEEPNQFIPRALKGKVSSKNVTA